MASGDGQAKQHRYDRRVLPLGLAGMFENESAASVEQRLSQQLHGLIDLTAELTKRLLATEERLLALETAPDARGGEHQPEVDQLLEEGQQQVRHLHLLLNPEAEGAEPEPEPQSEVVESPAEAFAQPEAEPIEAEHEPFIDEHQEHHDDGEFSAEDDDSQMPLLSA
jgi:hypothetical protein|tara:strand:+ start:151 stop:651 length:501 start_codon:yes stop_codon:yes gene_type:complete